MTGIRTQVLAVASPVPYRGDIHYLGLHHAVRSAMYSNLSHKGHNQISCEYIKQ